MEGQAFGNTFAESAAAGQYQNLDEELMRYASSVVNPAFNSSTIYQNGLKPLETSLPHYNIVLIIHTPFNSLFIVIWYAALVLS